VVGHRRAQALEVRRDRLEADRGRRRGVGRARAVGGRRAVLEEVRRRVQDGGVDGAVQRAESAATWDRSGPARRRGSALRRCRPRS
jgi:hypothetical protein